MIGNVADSLRIEGSTAIRTCDDGRVELKEHNKRRGGLFLSGRDK